MREATKLRILYFLVFSCTASWLPVLADYLNQQGLDGIEIGVILSITPFMMFMVQPLYGMMADRIGYKRCLIWSAFFAAGSFMLYIFDSSFIGLFFITVSMSLFYNGIQPLLDSLSLKLIQHDPSFSYGTLRIAGAAGWAITGTVVGYYIDSISMTVIFIFSAASMFLTFMFAFSLQPDPDNKNEPMTRSSNDLKSVLGNRDLIFLLLCVFLVSAGGTTIWNFYSIYMKENGASASLVGYGISFQGLCELPLFYLSARIIAKFGTKNTLLITVFALGTRMILYSVVKDPKAAIMIELLHGVSWSLFWVVCVEYVNSLVRGNWRATGQSLLYAAYFGAGAIAGNFWTGYLFNTKMKIADIFLINACVAFGVGIFILVFMKKDASAGFDSAQPPD